MPNEREMNKLADKFRQSSVEVIINAEGERRWYTLTEQESKHLADISINYRAELTAPAEGDVEAAEKAYKRAMIKASIKRKRGSLFLSSEIHKALVSEIAAALTTARKAERVKSKVAAELYLESESSYEAEIKGIEARIRVLEAENLGLRKTVGVDGKEIAELRADLAAARRDALNKAFPYTRGLLAKARAHVKVLEAAARSAEIDLGIAIDILEKHNYVHAKELQETRDTLAALLAGEGRGEEVDRK